MGSLSVGLSQWAQVEYSWKAIGWSKNVMKLLQQETIGQSQKQLFTRKIVQKCSIIQQTNQKLNNAVSCQDIPINTVQNIQLCENLLLSLLVKFCQLVCSKMLKESDI